MYSILACRSLSDDNLFWAYMMKIITEAIRAH
jgi:hypothetical protein